MAGNWPAVLPKAQDVFSQEYRRDTVRTPFESGYVQTFAKWTTGKYTFRLHWNALHEYWRDYLADFFDQMYGGGDYFTWTHPLTSVVHNVRFAEDGFRQTYITGTSTYWEVDVTLEET